MDYRKQSPPIVLDFLSYHEHIRGHSKKTIDEYFLDLRTFFRFLKLQRDLVPMDTPMEEISIADIDLGFVKAIQITDVYDFLAYLSRDREKSARSHRPRYGLSPTTRARKISTIRSFYKYLTTKAKLLEENPMLDLDSPKMLRSLPKFLSYDECLQLLASVDSRHLERDFCMITLFLNCGLRISELIGLNLSDIRQDHIRVLGKGNKERILYLNDACLEAIAHYLPIREKMQSDERHALFLSAQKRRISRSMVHHIVKRSLLMAGLDASQYSTHKLRHTAATLLLQNGVDVRTLQEVLGHEHLNTTQIYTHIDNNELRVAAQASPLAKVKPKTQKPEDF